MFGYRKASLIISSFLLFPFLISIATGPQPQIDSSSKQVLFAPYWALAQGFSSALVMNNTTGSELLVTPVAFNQAGASVRLNSIRLKPLESRNVDLAELVARAGSAHGGFGHLELEYQGEAFDLAAFMVISNAALNLSQSYTLVDKRSFLSSRLDGIFWLPRNTASAQIALTNTSDRS